MSRIEPRREIEGGLLRGIESAPGPADGGAERLRAELAQLTSDAFAEVYDPEPIDVEALFRRYPTTSTW